MRGPHANRAQCGPRRNAAWRMMKIKSTPQLRVWIGLPKITRIGCPTEGAFSEQLHGIDGVCPSWPVMKTFRAPRSNRSAALYRQPGKWLIELVVDGKPLIETEQCRAVIARAEINHNCPRRAGWCDLLRSTCIQKR